MNYEKETLDKIYEEFRDLYLIAELVFARKALSDTKPKMRNLIKTHKKYESFTDRIARKHGVSVEIIELCCEVDQYQNMISFEGIGGCDPERFWKELKTKIKEYLDKTRVIN